MTNPDCACHGTGELVALGSGGYLDLSAWNGDSGDLVDCDCKGEPMTTDRTALRERLIATFYNARSAWEQECKRIGLACPDNLGGLSGHVADALLTEFPELGQQPQTTLYVPASDLPPRFTPSDTHIKAGLVDIGQPLPTGYAREDSNTCPRCKGTGHVYVAMAADVVPHKNCPVCQGSGLARKDEPEPQVEWDEDAEWSKTCDLMRMAVADPFTSKRQDNEAVERIIADFDDRKALAKAVAERGGLPKTQPPSEPTIVKRGAL